MKYACVAVQSTGRQKYWNREGGWDEVVAHIKRRGFHSVCVDSFKETPYAKMPEACEDRTAVGLVPTLRSINGCSFFVGLSSGLAWLAWAAQKPVIMITGWTMPFTEFSCYRVQNLDVCHGCMSNLEKMYDARELEWCPEKKDFECTRTITPAMVIKQIDMAIDDHRL